MAINPKDVLPALKEALAHFEEDNRKRKLTEDHLRESIAKCERDIAEGKEYGGSK